MYPLGKCWVDGGMRNHFATGKLGDAGAVSLHLMMISRRILKVDVLDVSEIDTLLSQASFCFLLHHSACVMS